MILAVLAITLGGFVLGTIVMALGNRGVPREVARERWVKIGVFFVIVLAFLGTAALGTLELLALCTAIVLAGAVELTHAWRRIPDPRPPVVWLVYGTAAAALLAAAGRTAPAAFALVFLTVAAFDGFSQVTGQLVGRRKLAPHTSPGKTIEGAAGGIAAATCVALAARALAGLDAREAVLFGVVVAACGGVGDLAASWVKRRAGIKDYSDALPGQGGVLDRFDSLIAAGAIVPWLLPLWQDA